MKRIPSIAVSDGFDPVHKGHVQMIREASEYGQVIVILNSDDWLVRKKGYKFMSFEERAYIVGSLKGVTVVTSTDDSDGTVCAALKRFKPDYFANGGDRYETNTPEMKVCEEIGVESSLSEVVARGGEGGLDLANKIKRIVDDLFL